MEEVFDLVDNRLNQGMKLNIELKNRVYPYPGMEEKIVELVARRGYTDSVFKLLCKVYRKNKTWK